MVSYRRFKALVYDPLYIARNSLLFIFGAILFFVTTGVMNQGSLLALLGFILAYNSVYYINDLKDYEEDKGDVHKWKSKPLLNGSLTRKEAVFLYFFYLATGLIISFYTGLLFGFLVLLLLVLNILHSFVFKRIYFLLFANMILIQSMKVTLGWISVSASFDSFPIYFVFFLGASYSLGYLIYKRERSLVEVNPEKFRLTKRQYLKHGISKTFKKLFGRPTNLFFTVIVFASLIASYVTYSFRLHILAMLLVSAIIATMLKFVKGERFALYTTYHILIVTLFIMVITSFYLISAVPELAAVNQLLL